MSTDRETIASTEEVDKTSLRREKAKAYKRAYYERNRELVIARSKLWKEVNPEKARARSKADWEANREEIRARTRASYESDKKKTNARVQAWHKANPERRRTHVNTWLANNPSLRLARTLRARLRKIFSRGVEKSGSSHDLIGCSWSDLRAHLECQFTGDMSWENHGKGWHIDHIIPCAKFDLTKPEEQRACFHYTNLRPLCARKNIRESARKGIPQQMTMFHLLGNQNDL